jgi:hypothetical protein
MDTMENRERAFEAHFVFKEEMAFTVATYRNRLLGLWAGEQMGLSGGALDAYAQDVVHQSLSPLAALDPVARVARDLMAKGVASSPEDVREKFEACSVAAAARLAA